MSHGNFTNPLLVTYFVTARLMLLPSLVLLEFLLSARRSTLQRAEQLHWYVVYPNTFHLFYCARRFNAEFHLSWNLFPLYRGTLIESTWPVDFSSLFARSHETHHFYAISCEVYLGRILILRNNLVFHVVICLARTDCVTTTGEILTNGKSCLCMWILFCYLYTERMILLRDLKFCWIQIWKQFCWIIKIILLKP